MFEMSHFQKRPPGVRRYHPQFSFYNSAVHCTRNNFFIVILMGCIILNCTEQSVLSKGNKHVLAGRPYLLLFPCNTRLAADVTGAPIGPWVQGRRLGIGRGRGGGGGGADAHGVSPPHFPRSHA